jgi:anti-anti-sigma factor
MPAEDGHDDGVGATSDPDLTIDSWREDRRVVLVLVGELASDTCDQLDHVLAELDRCAELALDLSAVSFVDSAGLNLLLQANETLVAAGCALSVRPGTAFARLLELAALTNTFAIIGTDEAGGCEQGDSAGRGFGDPDRSGT